MIRRWALDAVAGLIVLVLALVLALAETTTLSWRSAGGPANAALMVMVATAVAVGLSRRAPGAALLVVWGSVLLEVLGTTLAEYQAPVMLGQAADLAVLYGAARWGRPLVVWLAALTVPIGGAVLALLADSVARAVAPIAGVPWLLSVGYQFGGHWRASAAVIGLLLLAVPWLLGSVVRVRAAAATVAAAAATEIAEAEAAREQASELARLRAEQARLARDVHDVVGHSLAVILAQAESAQYLPDSDPAALKATLATVADSARTSLRDIRQVLAATRDEAGVGADGLDQLIEGVRTGGREVLSTQSGTPVALDPERAEIAFRVLQEMFTNAIRHGRRDSAIVVGRDWAAAELTIEVRNGVDAGAGPAVTAGRGLTGMAERLRAVDGRLAFVRRGDVFAATAWIPEVRR